MTTKPARLALFTVFCLATGALCSQSFAADPAEYADFNRGDKKPGDQTIEWVKSIHATSPASGSEVKGDVTVTFQAPGMVDAKVSCWQQPTKKNSNPWGHDADVARDIKIDADGSGSFVFPADQFPNGPVNLRIYAKGSGKKQDVFHLQLYNHGGVVWNQGIPKNAPPATKGMKLVFADDFKGPLSISADGKGATYCSHKTGGGDFSGWPFSDNEGENNPFSQVGTFLRIHASKKPDGKSSSGIISSVRSDLSGIYASVPCYFECRFLAQSAPGTWPAFWLLTRNCLDKSAPGSKGSDELDIIEAYGGVGEHNPNFPGYASTSHYWDQPGPDGKQKAADHVDVPMLDLGGKSSWSTTFHTYAVKVTKKETIYYLDDIEVLRHPTGELSKTQPLWFMVNYAIGGISGWPIDLERYGNVSDMYVDYVRVYSGAGPRP